jgi:hypothetical protein
VRSKAFIQALVMGSMMVMKPLAAPAIIAAPPLAVEVFANLPGQSHVVGDDAAIDVGRVAQVLR